MSIDFNIIQQYFIDNLWWIAPTLIPLLTLIYFIAKDIWHRRNNRIDKIFNQVKEIFLDFRPIVHEDDRKSFERYYPYREDKEKQIEKRLKWYLDKIQKEAEGKITKLKLESWMFEDKDLPLDSHQKRNFIELLASYERYKEAKSFIYWLRKSIYRLKENKVRPLLRKVAEKLRLIHP
jgi:hypothetical protein